MLQRSIFRGLSRELSFASILATSSIAPVIRPEPEPQLLTVLQDYQSFSKSLLWQLERNYFNQQGIQAWNTGAVPHYVTSNPTIARAYAKVTLAYLQDNHQNNQLNPNHPLYILELGSGSGRFAFHFLKYLIPRLANLSFPAPPVTYLMTDFTQANLDYWQTHPHWQPWINSGQLDFAIVDATDIQSIHLTHRQQTLTPKTLKNPLVVIANYFFDCLPQDIFLCNNGTLHESLVTLTTQLSDPNLDDPDLINYLDISYTHQEITASYYADAHFNTILAHYQQTLSETCLLFPKVALECIQQLHKFANGKLLFLTADKGYSREQDLQLRQLPSLARHGNAFSLMVNYHAIGQYAQHLGGQFLTAAHQHTSINICGLLFGDSSAEYRQTHQAYTEHILNGGPDDFFAIKKAIEPQIQHFSLSQILAYLRLSHWDAHIFLGCFPTIMEQLQTASESLWQDLHFAIHQIWNHYYPIDEQRDLAFYCGMVLYTTQHYADALDYFQQSCQRYGDDASTLFNMGMCYYRLSQTKKAQRYFEQAVVLDPAFDPHVATVVKTTAFKAADT